MQIRKECGGQKQQVDAEQNQVGDQRSEFLSNDLDGGHDLIEDHDQEADVQKANVQHHLQGSRFVCFILFALVLFGVQQCDHQTDHLVVLGQLENGGDQIADEQKVLQMQVHLADLHLHLLTAGSYDVLHRVLFIYYFGHFDRVGFCWLVS